jgi:hypothetical protein
LQLHQFAEHIVPSNVVKEPFFQLPWYGGLARAAATSAGIF